MHEPVRPLGAEGAERERLGRTVSGAMAWSTAGRFGSMATALLVQALAARLLAPSEFGGYALVLSSAATIAFLSQAALPQSAVRLIAHAGTESAAAVRGMVASVSRTTLAMTALAVALSAGPLKELVEAAFPELPLDRVRWAFALLIGVRVIENVIPELFRGLRDFRGASLFGGLASGVAMAGICGALLALEAALDVESMLWVTIVAAGVPLLVAAVVMAARVHKLPVPDTRPRFDMRLVDPVLWAGTLISFVITQIDLWIVGIMRSPSDVALYGAAFRLSTLVMVPAAIANFVVPPLVVQMHARGERQRLQRLLQGVAGLASIPAALLVGGFVVFGEPLSAAVYGDYYREAGVLVAILALGKLGNVFTGACGVTLIMTGGARENLVVMAANAAMTVPLQVLLLRHYGLSGLAAATAIGLVAQNVMLLVVARRRAGVWTFAHPGLALQRALSWLRDRSTAKTDVE